MYTVIELQTNNGTTTALPPVTKTTKDEAEQEMHLKLSYAAVSQVETHSVILLNAEGQRIDGGCFKHSVAE